MKINQIISETTTSGSIAPVSHSFVKMQSRNPSVYSGDKPGTLFKGKKTKKPYANSVNENEKKKKDFLGKLQKNVDKSNKQKKDTEEKVKQHQQDDKKKVEEAKLEEDDIIVIPGGKSKRKNGFVAKGQSRVDHEVEMARSDVLATMKNAKAIYELLKNRSEEDGIEGWVQEKLIKANDYLNAVKEYYDEKMMQQETVSPGGVIAGGGFEESANAFMPGIENTPEYKQGFATGKLPVPYPEGSQQYVNYYKGVLAKAGPKTKKFEASKVNEKAVSKAQQKFMGMVHAVQKGEMKAPSKEVAKAAKGMSKKAGHEFAATKHKGLPEKVDEVNWKKGLATAALAAGTLGAMGGAHGRVMPSQDSDPSINRLTGKPNVPQVAPSQEEPGARLPNQNLDTAQKVEITENGITINYDGKEDKAIEVPKDSPTPRGAKMIKVTQAQMGIRGIGNYTTYLLPSGKAYIYSK